MNKIVKYLEKLGFSENEAKLYLILLNNGSFSAAELAEKAKLNRTAVYGYINNLFEKGVVAKSKGASNKIIANPPEQLRYLVEEKLSEANILKEQLYPVVTVLNSSFMRASAGYESDIKYFKGKTGIKVIYEDVLKANEIRAYFNPVEIQKYLPENIGLFENAIVNNPNMKVYEIVEDSQESRKYIGYAKNTKRHYWRYLPKDIKLTSNDILIYDGKVAIINLLGKDKFYGSIFENRDYFNNSKQLFDLLWRLLPEF